MQLTSFFTVQTFSWFEPFNSTTANSSSDASYENYAVFSLSALQYVILAVCFHKGPPYVSYVCSNYFLVGCLAIVGSVTVYIILSPAQWLQQQMEIKLPPEMNFRLMVIGFGFINFVLSFFVESVICDFLITDILKRRYSKQHTNYFRYFHFIRFLYLFIYLSITVRHVRSSTVYF